MSRIRYFILSLMLGNSVLLFSQQCIVVLGSSTAAGVGPSVPDSSWVNLFAAHQRQKHPGNTVINLAKGGYTTYHILPTGTAVPDGRPAPDTARNITKALQYHPDAIIINMPSNDAAAGFPLSEQLKNYNLLDKTAEKGMVTLWIASPQGRNLSAEGKQLLLKMHEATYDNYAEFAINFFNVTALPDGSLRPVVDAGDGIHLNNYGHRLLFQQVVLSGVSK